MKHHIQTDRKSSESGNVLFLILIAVALFAALSYAVTQSSRSGAGDANSEKSLVSSSAMSEYPAGIRTSIMRMIVSNGISASELMFNSAASFGTAITTANETKAVFHPKGGGATYQQAPLEVMSSTSQGTWHFNALYQIPGIGVTTTGGDTAGNDVIAFLDNVKKSVCEKVNAQLGISPLPVISGALADLDEDQVADGNAALVSTFDDTTAGTPMTMTTGDISGQPFGCFQNGTGGHYVYYHVLIER